MDERGFPLDEIQFNYTQDIFQTGAKISIFLSNRIKYRKIVFKY